MTATAAPEFRLPLWRTITGFAVLGSLVAVLLALAPVYITNYRLTGKVKTLVAASASDTEDVLRQKLIAEARTFDVTALAGDVKITRNSQALDVQVKYIVRKNLGLYQVDLHFHPSARTPLPVAPK